MKRTALNRAYEEMEDELLCNNIRVSFVGRYARWGKIIFKIPEGTTKEKCKSIFRKFIREHKIIKEAKFNVENRKKQPTLLQAKTPSSME